VADMSHALASAVIVAILASSRTVVQRRQRAKGRGPLDPAWRFLRDRAIAISFVTSSSPMVNSTTSRGAAMMQGLVQRIIKRR
jgi:hypothetical protein